MGFMDLMTIAPVRLTLRGLSMSWGGSRTDDDFGRWKRAGVNGVLNFTSLLLVLLLKEK